MTITQYFEKIKGVCVSEEVKENYDLQDNTESIILNGNETYFNFLSLFEEYSKGVNQEIINQIANTLGLLYIKEREIEGNVCFANNEDLRSEFKESFTLMNLLDYIFAILHSKVYHQASIAFVKIPIPSDFFLFWQMVKIGAVLRSEKI